MAKKLLSADAARAALRRRYDAQQRAWLAGEGNWPLSIPLGDPTEKTVAHDPQLVREWVDDWSGWSDGGEVQWVERQWPRLGTQRLPARLVLGSPSDVARVVGDAARFECASERYAMLVTRWSALSGSPQLTRHFDALADYADEDFRRLVALLAWLDEHRRSACYLRQLPIEGMDTKWTDARRRALVTDLLQASRGLAGPQDFHDLCGLRRPSLRLRLRLLCPELRRSLGGLGDVEAPIEQVAGLDLQPERALIVENLETGIALPDVPRCVAFMKLGFGASLLGQIPWLQRTDAAYWGDLDTHGFAILHHARAALPSIRSILMDETTLLQNRALWGREPTPYANAELAHLTTDERALFEKLRTNAWGHGVRLEQERVPWPTALRALREAWP